MRLSIFLCLFAFCVTIYSQDRICFIDSLDFCKDEIEKLERYNLKKIKRKYPAYRKYSNLKQLHFFMLKNKTNCPITKEEIMNYILPKIPKELQDLYSCLRVIENMRYVKPNYKFNQLYKILKYNSVRI